MGVLKTPAAAAGLLTATLAAAGDWNRHERHPEVMTWEDLTSRPKPSPDATIEYGEDPLQVVDVWRPAGDGPHPAVVMLHGGCWQTEIAERDLMNWAAADLRAAGVGVWNVEYRGTDRDGGGFPGTYEDVAAAADLFRERAGEFGLRADRVVVVGHSAGGHLALWLANRPSLPEGHPLRGDDPLHVDVAVVQGGLPDVEAASKREGHPCGCDAPAAMLGEDPAATSPPRMAAGQTKQVLFNTTLDHVAWPDYARAYRDAVAKRGVAVELVVTPGEGHVELIAPGSETWAAQKALILKELGIR